MNEMWITIALGVVKFFAFTYDIITFLPYYLIEQPNKKLEVSRRLKAKKADGGSSTRVPYRTIDCFDHLTTSPFSDCKNIDDLFIRAVKLYGPTDCLGSRELLSEEDEIQPNGKVFRKAIFGKYHWETYDEINKRVINFASGLLALDRSLHSNVCIFAETRAEWIISMFASFKSNLPVVTLYATLGEEAILYGLQETDVNVVITSQELLPKLQQILTQLPKVKHIVYIEGRKKPVISGFPSTVELHSFTSLEDLGAKPDNLRALEMNTRPKAEDLALIMYTSGSTGTPKGVMISHFNLLSGMSGQVDRVPNLGPPDTYVGYLPLAHILELSAEVSCVTHGVRIGFSSPTTLSDQSTRIKKGSKGDVSVLRPTLMTTVPVIMDRLYKAVWDKVNEGGKFQKALFNFAFEYKKKNFDAGFDTPMINKFVFKKVRALLGGRVRMMLSGGAPLSEDTQKFMNICFCCPVGQGYGLTETCGAGTIQEVTDRSTGRVGAPLTCNEVMLVSWSEGDYHVTDSPCPRGEIWLGGGNIALGYYKNPEKTAEDFHSVRGQRWFATGDIGQFEPDGSLRIIDRKKDLVKLQAGEYVSLAKVETMLKMCPLVDNLCLYADSSKMYTVCLVVPNQKHVQALAKTLGIIASEWPFLCENPQIEAAVLKALQNQGAKGKLEKFEIPQKIKMVMEQWTPDSGLVTEAFKLRRKNIESHYLKDIIRMYA